MDDALSVAMEGLDALNRGEWRRLADLTDPDDLRVWYEQWLQLPDAPPREFTAEDILRHEPDMPEEVARYHADRVNRRASEAAGTLEGQFAGLNTTAELARVEPAEALARYLEAQDSERLSGEWLNTRRPGRAWVRDAVGVVHEGADCAHVVYRVRRSTGEDEHGRGSTDRIAVATLRRTSGGWRLRLGGEVFDWRGRTGRSRARARGQGLEGPAEPRQRTDGA